MSVKLMSMIFEAKFPDLPIGEKVTGETAKVVNVGAPVLKFVCLALADHANDEGEGAYPSVDTLSEKTDLTRRSVINALNALKMAGIISCSGISRYKTKNYTLSKAALAALKRQGGAADSPSGVQQIHPGGAADSPRGVQQIHPGGAADSPESSINHPLNHPLTTHIAAEKSAASGAATPRRTAAEKKGDMLDGMIHFAGLQQRKVDLAEYPEDVRETLQKFCEKWNLQPPAKSRRKGGEFDAWIYETRNLRQACGEFGDQVLDSLANNPPGWWKQNGFVPAHPRSVVSSARARAAELRKTERQSQPAALDAETKSKLAELRQKYGKPAGAAQ